MTDWDDVTITVVPDPCWTPAMEAAAQEWLALIRHLERKGLDGASSRMVTTAQDGDADHVHCA